MERPIDNPTGNPRALPILMEEAEVDIDQIRWPSVQRHVETAVPAGGTV